MKSRWGWLVHSHSASVHGNPGAGWRFYFQYLKILSLLMDLSKCTHTHTHTHRASDSLMTLICILTKEVIENEEDTDVGREKTLKAHRQRRKKQVESTALLVHSPPAPTGATRPSLGESGACGWSRWSTLCGTQDTHNRTLVSMGSFFL